MKLQCCHARTSDPTVSPAFTVHWPARVVGAPHCPPTSSSCMKHRWNFLPTTLDLCILYASVAVWRLWFAIKGGIIINPSREFSLAKDFTMHFLTNGLTSVLIPLLGTLDSLLSQKMFWQLCLDIFSCKRQSETHLSVVLPNDPLHCTALHCTVPSTGWGSSGYAQWTGCSQSYMLHVTAPWFPVHATRSIKGGLLHTFYTICVLEVAGVFRLHVLATVNTDKFSICQTVLPQLFVFFPYCTMRNKSLANCLKASIN